jgi:uncharacterized membrane protein YjgN (DUF898 family)
LAEQALPNIEQWGGSMPLDMNTARTARFTFTGKGSEYFRIWIVNLALTIVTLGIYSAWAKVRRLKYFYLNTSLAGGSFDYHGDPMAILKGRIIAVGLVGIYQFSGIISPFLGLAAMALLGLIFPWLIVRSLKFRLHNSSYRGLRFSFRGSTREGYSAFLLMPVLAVFTVYLLAPLAHQRIKRYQHTNSWYGDTRFGFSATPGKFFGLYLKLLGLALLVILLVVAAIGVMHSPVFFNIADQGPEARKRIASTMLIAGIGSYILLFLLIGPWFAARIQNLVWNHTSLGPHRFVSNVQARGLFWIYLTNFLGIVLTLGLFKPFADIRLARYRMEHVGIIPTGSLEEIAAGRDQSITATGEEAIGMFDFDISF